MTNSTPSGLPGASGDPYADTTGTGGTYATTGTGDTYTGATGATGTGGTSGTQPPIKDDAKALAHEAREEGQRVAGVAKGEAKGVASETKRQARRLAGQARDELRSQAATQQARVASGLHGVGGQLSSMADRSDEPGMASDLVREAGDRVDRVAYWLDQRDPGSLLVEVKSFARRRPGVFLAVALGAGVVAGRLTRALMTPDEDEDAVGYGGTPNTKGTRPTTVMPGLTPAEATGLGTSVGAGATGTLGATGTAGATDWTDPTAGTDPDLYTGADPDLYTETPSVEEPGERRGGF